MISMMHTGLYRHTVCSLLAGMTDCIVIRKTDNKLFAIYDERHRQNIYHYCRQVSRKPR